MRWDGARHDQLVAKLSLQPGEHQLVLQIEQQSPGPRQFYFSLAADPVGCLWRQLEQDVARDANQLLRGRPGGLARLSLDDGTVTDVVPKLKGRHL